jgi:hypothetical protein
MPLVVALIVPVPLLRVALDRDGLMVAALIAAPLAIAVARLWARVEAVEGELAVLRRAARPVPAAEGGNPGPWPPKRTGPCLGLVRMLRGVEY